MKALDLSGLWRGFAVCFLLALGQERFPPRAQPISFLPVLQTDIQKRHVGFCRAIETYVSGHLLSPRRLKAGDLIVRKGEAAGP